MKKEGYRNIQVDECSNSILGSMGSKIPKVVREKVITEWLQGLSRDKIAVNNDIGGGTVTEIIKDYSENNSDVDKQREFVVALMREGTDLNLFASSIRLKRFLERLGIDEERLDSFLVNVQEHCFKKDKETNDFIKSVNDACRVSNRMETSIEDLPEKLQDMKNELDLLEKDIKQKRAERTLILLNYRMTEGQLEEYGKTGLLAVIEKLRRQLATVIKICVQGEDWLKKELAFERFAHEALAAELANCRKALRSS
jgi:predicted RNase H-like nuclease (RuvC/YqgF family)